VCIFVLCLYSYITLTLSLSVDYILFLTVNVTVTPNPNEIRDYKYVSKEELEEMFRDTCAYEISEINMLMLIMWFVSKFVYPLVQTDCSRISLWLVERTLPTER
jgi:hypothetical protein